MGYCVLSFNKSNKCEISYVVIKTIWQITDHDFPAVRRNFKMDIGKLHEHSRI